VRRLARRGDTIPAVPGALRSRPVLIAVGAGLLVVAAVVAVLLATRGGHDDQAAGHGGHGGEAAAISPVRFIDLMIPHHEAAIGMAEDALARRTDPDLKGIALDVITAQRFEIAQMRRIRERIAAGEPVYAPTAEDLAAMGMGHDHAAMDGSAPYEVAWAEMMIPHHAGALVLAQRVLEGDPPADLARLARGMLRSQAQEIGLLEALRQEHLPQPA
jgi:uncharacterized protein (DUF305 family)